MRENASQRSLGITTEIAFFAGKAVLKVVNVAEGSPAQRVGIKSGLLILFADDRPLTDPEILATAERESDGILVLRVVDPQTRVEQTIRADLR
jgi:S1-C subfamily serine protease